MKHLGIPTNPVALHPCIVYASATTDMSQLPRASCHRWSQLPPAGGLRRGMGYGGTTLDDFTRILLCLFQISNINV